MSSESHATATEVYPRYRWVIIGLSMLFMQANTLVALSLGVLLPVMRQDLGFNPLQAGWLGSVNGLAPAFLTLPLTFGVIRHSPKVILSLSMGWCSLFGFLQGLAPFYWVLLVARGLYALALTINAPVMVMIRLQWVPFREMATVHGLQLALGGISHSFALAISPLMLSALGTWRYIVMLYSGLVMVTAILWTILGKERISPQYRAAMESRPAGSQTWTILRRKEFWMLGFAFFGNISAWTAIAIFLPSYLVEDRGFSLTTAGLISSVMPIGSMLGALTSGLVSDRIGLRRPVIWPAGLLSPLAYLALLLPVPELALAALAFLVGFLIYWPAPPMHASLYELKGLGPREITLGQALTSTIMSWAQVVAPTMVGGMFQFQGSFRAGLRVAAFFPLTVAVMGFLIPETGPRVRERETQSVS